MDKSRLEVPQYDLEKDLRKYYEYSKLMAPKDVRSYIYNSLIYIRDEDVRDEDEPVIEQMYEYGSFKVRLNGYVIFPIEDVLSTLEKTTG